MEAAGADDREGADLPVSHEVVMKDHTKVRAISITLTSLTDISSPADRLRPLHRPLWQSPRLGFIRLRLQALGLWGHEFKFQAVPQLGVQRGPSGAPPLLILQALGSCSSIAFARRSTTPNSRRLATPSSSLAVPTRPSCSTAMALRRELCPDSR